MASTTPIATKKLQEIWVTSWKRKEIKSAIKRMKNNLRTTYPDKNKLACISFLEADRLIGKFDLPAPLIGIITRFIVDDSFDPTD